MKTFFLILVKHWRKIVAAILIFVGGRNLFQALTGSGFVYEHEYLETQAPIYCGLTSGLAIASGLLFSRRTISLRALSIAVLLVASCIAATHVAARRRTVTKIFDNSDSELTQRDTLEIFNGAVIPELIRSHVWRTNDPDIRLWAKTGGPLALDSHPYRDGSSSLLASMIEDFVNMHRAMGTTEEELASYMAGDLFMTVRLYNGESKAREIMEKAAECTTNPDLKRAFKVLQDPSVQPSVGMRF